MRIQLAGLSGSFMGRAFDFPQQPVVTLGRNPQNNVAADPPREPMVSDKHAEIYEERGGIFIRDLNSTNGTYINGQRIALPTLLMPGMTLRLGGAGPELQILTLALEQGTPGMGQPAGFGAPQAPQPQPWGAPPTPSPYPAPQTPQPAHAGAHPHGMDLAMPGLNAPPPYPVGGAKQGIGLMTLQREISNAKAEVRFEEGKKRRTALVVLSMVLLVGMIISVIVWAVIGSKIENNNAPFEEVVDKHKHAIYLIYLERTEGNRKSWGHGTGFALCTVEGKFGILGTNAHVTNEVLEFLQHNGSGFAICNQDPNTKYRIVGAVTHPKYEGMDDIFEKQSPDVGIVKVDLEIGGKVTPFPETLSPATNEEMALKSGQNIASLGFPGIEEFSRHYYEKGDKGVVAKYSQGSVSNLMNFNFTPSPVAKDFELLEHTIPTFNGSSGSPIFLSSGRVVALHNSAPKAIVEGPDGKPQAIGRGLQAYGISVRFLKDLVEANYPGAWH